MNPKVRKVISVDSVTFSPVRVELPIDTEITVEVQGSGSAGTVWFQDAHGKYVETPLAFDPEKGMFVARIPVSQTSLPEGSYQVRALLNGEDRIAEASAPSFLVVTHDTFPVLKTEIERFRAYFEYDSSILRGEYDSKLSEFAQIFRTYRGRISRILIQGHCDVRGTVEYNHELGEKRAGTLARVLNPQTLGVPLDIVSLDESNPEPPDPTEEAYAENRWARIVVETRH